MEKNASDFLKKIDFTTLRTQKTALISSIEYFKNNHVPGIQENLDGILNLIDSIQDFAVDELGWNENDVYDFELEEKRDIETSDEPTDETPEEKFARENAETIWDMRTEGDSYLDEGGYDNGVTEDFIQAVVDDPVHAAKIKENMRLKILNDVTNNPNDFKRDENDDYTYDAEMYDYGFAIDDYCQNLWDSHHYRDINLCSLCGSDNIELKAWVKPNEGNEFVNYVPEEECFCNDCESHSTETNELKALNQHVIGFQVYNKNHVIHPKIPSKHHIFNLKNAWDMIEDDEEKWYLKTVWSGDIKNPIMMFEGNPRSEFNL